MGLTSIVDGIRSQATYSRNTLPIPEFNLDSEEHRVLIVYFFNGLGDAALLAPVLAAIQTEHPDLELGILVPPLAARTMKLFDLRLRIHEISHALISKYKLPAKSLSKDLRNEAVRLEEELRRRDYTIGVDLSCRDGFNARVWLDKAEVYTRIGWIRDIQELERNELDFGTFDIRSNTDRHWSYANMLPFQSMVTGGPRFDLTWKLTSAKKDHAESRWSSGKRVLVVPGSADEAKRWDIESFARVLSRIHQSIKTNVVICGGPSEKELVLSLKRQVSHPCGSFTGKDLGTLLALIQSADLVITNDTGPMHLAFLSQIPTLAIFTRMSPMVWGPPLDLSCFRIHRQNHEVAEKREAILVEDCLDLLRNRV